MKIRFIRWSMTVIEMDGLTIVTDPFFRVWGRFRVPPRAYGIEQMPTPDLILVSHRHFDHWDRWAMVILSRRSNEIPLVVRPKKIKPDAERLGFTDVRELYPYQDTRVKGLTVTAVPAHHPGKEVGFIVQGEKNLYFAGDTSFNRQTLGKIGEHFALDVVLLPVGGLRMVGRGTQMDPHQALEAIQLLRPRIVVGIHWGGIPAWFPLAKMPGTPRELARFVIEAGMDVRVLGFEPLESVEI